MLRKTGFFRLMGFVGAFRRNFYKLFFISRGMGAEDYRLKYALLYHQLWGNPEVREELERLLFPVQKTYGRSLRPWAKELSDIVEAHIEGFDTEDALKALVAYGKLNPHYGIELAESYRYLERRKRLQHAPLLRRLVNFLSVPLDMAAGGGVFYDPDWIELLPSPDKSNEIGRKIDLTVRDEHKL